MKFTKIKSLILLSFAGLVLAGCGGGGDNPQPAQKKDVSISIALEDGKQFDENTFATPLVTVDPSSITPTITYYKGEQSLGATAPQTVGDYKITATTAETAEYNAGIASKSFLIRKVPSISFYYGNNQPLEANHKFDLKDGEFTITAKASIEGVTPTISYMDQNGTAVNGKPNSKGVYFAVASVARTSTIGNVEKSIQFEIIDSSSAGPVDPVIKFFYNGVQKCLETSWLETGYADSQYLPSEFDVTKLSYTVNPSDANIAVTWTLNEAPIAAPSNPLKPGTYAMTVTVTADAKANADVKWALFLIKDAGKTEPTIKFFYNGTEKCLENNWLETGYTDSQYNANEFDVTKLTYSVSPDAEAEVSWTLDEAPIAAPTNPLQPGTYAMTVSVKESETVSAKTKWALFAIKAGKTDPVIKFFYNGVQKCLESNWLESGYADSQYNASDFDVSKLTYTVTPELAANVSWTLNEVAIDAPTGTLASGTYAMTVKVAAGENNNEATQWALFVIK